MDEMIENMSQIYTDLSKEEIYDLLIAQYRERRATNLHKSSTPGKFPGSTKEVGLEDPAVLDYSIKSDSGAAAEFPTLGQDYTTTEEKGVSECTICLEGLKETKRYKLKCDHSSFHFECIRKWLMDNKNCPICRTAHFDEEEYPSLS